MLISFPGFTNNITRFYYSRHLDEQLNIITWLFAIKQSNKLQSNERIRTKKLIYRNNCRAYIILTRWNPDEYMSRLGRLYESKGPWYRNISFTCASNVLHMLLMMLCEIYLVKIKQNIVAFHDNFLRDIYNLLISAIKFVNSCEITPSGWKMTILCTRFGHFFIVVILTNKEVFSSIFFTIELLLSHMQDFYSSIFKRERLNKN